MIERMVVITSTYTFLRSSVHQYCQVMSGQSLKLLVAMSTISVGVEQVCMSCCFGLADNLRRVSPLAVGEGFRSRRGNRSG